MSSRMGSKHKKSRRGNSKALVAWNKATREAGFGIAAKGTKKYNHVCSLSKKYKSSGLSAFDAHKKAAKEVGAYIPKKGSAGYLKIKRIYNSS